MKIIGTTTLPDHKVEVTLCKCKGPESRCKPSERPKKVFKSMETMKKWASAFRIGNKK